MNIRRKANRPDIHRDIPRGVLFSEVGQTGWGRERELVVRCLYRTQDGPGPDTKARRREVEELTLAGLERALEALVGGAEVVGTSGFTTRECFLSGALPQLCYQGEGVR